MPVASARPKKQPAAYGPARRAFVAAFSGYGGHCELGHRAAPIIAAKELKESPQRMIDHADAPAAERENHQQAAP